MCLTGANRLFREIQSQLRLYEVWLQKREVKTEQKFKSSKSIPSPYKIKELAKLVQLIIQKESGSWWHSELTPALPHCQLHTSRHHSPGRGEGSF